MTLVLGLDTATDRATIALGAPARTGGGTHEIALPARRELSRDIERVTAALLRREHAEPRDLGGVIVADGPGSFTGLRIGVAFAKGLCRALGIPLWATPSMLGAATSVARSVGAAVPRLTVVVEYDALRGEVYRAIYEFEGGAVVARAAPDLAPAGGGGSGAEGGPLPDAATAGEAQASAASLIAALDLTGGAVRVPDPAAWEPAYGRPAEAEARRLRRGGGDER